MRERPILLNAEMVRAVLDGRKTQTRRIMKVQPESSAYGLSFITESFKNRDTGKYFWSQSDGCGINKPRSKRFSCPFGAVDDRLWVRETFNGFWLDDDVIQEIKEGISKASELCSYRADYPDGSEAFEGWTPSIHMPRWASRITLEITGVRVERLNNISESDAIAEGLAEISKDGHTYKYGVPDRDGYPGTDDFGWPWHEWERYPISAYSKLWKSIYGEESWQDNPFVWVIEFKRVDNTTDKAG